MSKGKTKFTPLGAAYRRFSENGCATVEWIGSQWVLGYIQRTSIHRDYFQYHQPLEESLVGWLDHHIAKVVPIHYYGA